MLDLAEMRKVSDYFLKDSKRYLTDKQVYELFVRTGLIKGECVRMVMYVICQEPKTNRPKARGFQTFGKDGRPRIMSVLYKPKEVRNFHAVVAVESRTAFGSQEWFKGPVQVDLVHFKVRPKTQTKEARNSEWCITKPDVDNTTKNIFDPMNKVIFKDDAQVCKLNVEKRYAAQEYLVVTIIEMGY